MKPTLNQLLRWAKGKATIFIYRNGFTELEIPKIHYASYHGDTLYQALYKAWKAEKK